jgi:hypothetical protein
MNIHIQNIAKVINSVYIAWGLVVNSLIALLYSFYSSIYNWEFYFYLVTFILFLPTLVQYHVLKTVDEWGNKNK